MRVTFSTLSRPERIVDLLLGASLCAWSGQWFYEFALDSRHRAAATLVMGVFQAWVGVLFLLRDPVTTPGTARSALASVPSVLFSGVALKLSAPAAQWPVAQSVLFLAGAVLALSSLSFLGKSFAILPAPRATIRRGPYRWIRHPAYLGELVMALACAAASPWPRAIVVMPLTVVFLVIRILAEESELNAGADYRAYAAAVPWRLAPKIW